jgi:tetratricopeptide (TPR) repeat protein
MKASQILAEHIAEHSSDARGVLHPRFVASMEHACLPGNEFVRASRRDHAPLTDLRLRRDDSSQQMLRLNLRAWRAASPATYDTMAAKVALADRMDTPGLDVLALDSNQPATFAPIEAAPSGGTSDTYETLLKYVNCFGSWEDAEAMAFAYAKAPSLESSRLRGLTSGLAGVVVGLSAQPESSDRLFEDSVANLEGSFECYFAYLRWASLTAKRRRDLDLAEALLERGLTLHTHAGSSGDVMLATGLADNLRALLALRRGDSALSRQLVDHAIARLRAAVAAENRSDIRAEETARYLWMAELNAAQLDLSVGDDDRAIERLRALRVFAEQQDRGALHTTLSTLAFVHLKRGEPGKAAPLLTEALDLLRHEYDPSVVTQVRKMLFRSYIELGDRSRADDVRALSPYFWLGQHEEASLVH